MCMIAYRPVKPGKHGANLPDAVATLACQRHPDGFGIAWRDAEGLHDERFAPSERKAFRATLKRIDALPVEYVAHWRYATHGPKDRDHAHPYEYIDPTEGRVLVFHNGVIDIDTTHAESDTERFVRDVLPSMPSAWWRDPSLVWLVNNSIGWSRLTLMTATETVNLHERNGEWDNGIWYSSAHRPYNSFTSTAVVGGVQVAPTISALLTEGVHEDGDPAYLTTSGLRRMSRREKRAMKRNARRNDAAWTSVTDSEYARWKRIADAADEAIADEVVPGVTATPSTRALMALGAFGGEEGF